MTKNKYNNLYNNTFYEILTLTKYSLFYYFSLMMGKNDAENCIKKYFWIIIKKLQSERKIFSRITFKREINILDT